MELLFATHNANKVKEINLLLDDKISVVIPEFLGFLDEVAETGSSFKANALLKVEAYLQHYNGNIFSEDTGLEVAFLKGAPGIFTARYAGENANANENMDKLLNALGGNTNRRARFKTVICLRWKEKIHYFEGICDGEIASAKSGTDGFGYDPIFIPDGHSQSFAMLGAEVKKQKSHRAIALKKMITFINDNIQ